MGIYIQTPRIKTFRLLAQLKIHADVVFRNHTGTVRSAFKVLFDSHSGNKIQIDILCHVEYGFTDKISRVQRNIQVPSKTKRLGRERNESQVRTPVTLHIQCIEQVIFIKGRPNRRKRTHKTLQKQRYIVLINIDFTKDFIQKLLYPVTRKDLIHSGRFVSFHHCLLRPRVATVIHGLCFFLYRNRKNRRTDIQRIYKF